MTVADREFVQQRKIWRNFPDEKSHCIHFKSVDHNDVPYKKKVVRAETIISGYYMSTMSIDPPKTRLISVSQTDIKVNTD